jgi:hypothetical protein
MVLRDTEEQLRSAQVTDALSLLYKLIGMSKEIRQHLQERTPFKNERW